MPAKYKLADKSYAEWLLKLQDKNFETISPSIKQNIVLEIDGHSTGNNQVIYLKASIKLIISSSTKSVSVSIG